MANPEGTTGPDNENDALHGGAHAASGSGNTTPPAEPKQKDEEEFGTLNKAKMRTFRGDIETRLGNKASAAIEKFVPNRAQRNIQEKREPDSPRDDGGASNKPNKDAIVRTFKDDVRDLVRTQKMSLARMAALESGKEGVPELPQREPWKTTTIIALTMLFFAAGGVLLFGVYYAYQWQDAGSAGQELPPSMIFTEARERVDITGRRGRQVVQMLALARSNALLSLGSMLDLYLMSQVDTTEGTRVLAHLSAAEFLRTIEASVPETFLQTLGEDYMVGLHIIDENVPFILLSTNSYGYAFSGMLAWEPRMEEDLAPFMSPRGGPATPVTAGFGRNEFTDTVVENIDVRILRDANGETRLLYAFDGRDTIIITTNLRSLVELANRIRVAR
ncbi:MAG: hypothetical protein Q8P16_02160 [bacterium]|nr:hypothetical protein [bacterium]